MAKLGQTSPVQGSFFAEERMRAREVSEQGIIIQT
jgi:hypothetical protein